LAVQGSFDICECLARRRTYARKGQVMDIKIEKGVVQVKVQGSRSRPYKVEVLFHSLSRAQWGPIVKDLAGRFLATARLLASELPEEVEGIFQSAKVSLFPDKLRDLETDCSCPDWSNPMQTYSRGLLSAGRGI
jgi:uncharacterized Zn finger protein